jgi:hypothetical protein
MPSATATASERALHEAVAAMSGRSSGDQFFDVTIICSTDDHQASHWMSVLQAGLLRNTKCVLAVSEDWTSCGGAGNGLGTLYAFQKACRLAASTEKLGTGAFDLAAELASGSVSAALYHTAGKGTRMAPLPASENNNKPGVVSACGPTNKRACSAFFYSAMRRRPLDCLNLPFWLFSLSLSLF